MAEPIGVSFKVGGVLPASLVDEFLECLSKDIDNSDGNLGREHIEDLGGPLEVYGNADYGLCNLTHDFCIKHDLTFVATAVASGEYNACTTFFSPGMEDSETYDTDSNGNAVIRSSKVRPLIDFMLALVEREDKALPLFLNNPAIADTAKECLEQPDKISSILREQIKQVVPNEAPDEVPPLVIDESR